MATLPYITATGNIDKVLNAIKAAAVPERVSQDFVKTILKIPGGSGDQMTTYLKKLNFASNDGKPTELYTKYRNPSTSGQAVAAAIKHAYAPLYVRNEYMHTLSDDDLAGLIIEETGQPHDSNAVKLALSCIRALKGHADFEAPEPKKEEQINDGSLPQPETNHQGRPSGDNLLPPSGMALNLGYTINLNLPATSDQAVFNAIFKSLKQHLLSVDDA